MTVVDPTLQSGLPEVAYYAPAFRIEVDGQELSPSTNGDVLELSVTLDLKDPAQFDLTVSNWDDSKYPFGFKYSDGEDFNVGRTVEVQMGYADKTWPLVYGWITTMNPRFPESGTPTLSVSGVDRLFALKDRKPVAGDQRKFVNMTDVEIANIIATRNHLGFKGGLTDAPKQPLVVQKNQDDLQFVKERAARLDAECYIRRNPDPNATEKETLYFIAPSDQRDGRRTRVFVFEWGKNLRSVSPRLTLSKQVTKLTVRGWNPLTKEEISYTATSDDLKRPTNAEMTGPQVLEKLIRKEEVTVDQPVETQEEAKKLAISLLQERAYEFVTATVQTIGIPNLRPGDNVWLKNLGRRFSGSYYVTKAVHTINNSGFVTEFDGRRTFEQQSKSNDLL
jgi:phage protein D